MSRATIRTEANKAKILHEMEANGKPFEVAAAAAGISPSAAWSWKGEDKQFGEEVARARFAGASNLHDRILLGDERGLTFGPSRAALEVLGRTLPSHYSPKIQVSVAKELDKFLSAAERALPPEMCELLFAELSRALNSPDDEPSEAED